MIRGCTKLLLELTRKPQTELTRKHDTMHTCMHDATNFESKPQLFEFKLWCVRKDHVQVSKDHAWMQPHVHPKDSLYVIINPATAAAGANPNCDAVSLGQH